jgi:hypothetical protein
MSGSAKAKYEDHYKMIAIAPSERTNDKGKYEGGMTRSQIVV